MGENIFFLALLTGVLTESYLLHFNKLTLGQSVDMV